MEMEPERWQRVEELYHRALELDAGRRVAFLEDSCGDDTVLRHEVESLLAREKQAEHFMEAPALEALGKQVANESLLPGRRRKTNWQRRFPLPGHREDWRRRHGRGLQGRRHPPASFRGAEVSA